MLNIALTSSRNKASPYSPAYSKAQAQSPSTIPPIPHPRMRGRVGERAPQQVDYALFTGLINKRIQNRNRNKPMPHSNRVANAKGKNMRMPSVSLGALTRHVFRADGKSMFTWCCGMRVLQMGRGKKKDAEACKIQRPQTIVERLANAVIRPYRNVRDVSSNFIRKLYWIDLWNP